MNYYYFYTVLFILLLSFLNDIFNLLKNKKMSLKQDFEKKHNYLEAFKKAKVKPMSKKPIIITFGVFVLIDLIALFIQGNYNLINLIIHLFKK